MIQSLNNIYTGKGKVLPKTADERFADPEFAAAASQAGITKDQYKVNSGNAGMNESIASLLGSPSSSITPATTNTVAKPGSIASKIDVSSLKYTNPELDKTIESATTNANATYQDSDFVKELRRQADERLAESRRRREERKGQIRNEFTRRGNVANASQIRQGLAGSGYDEAQNQELATEETKANVLSEDIFNSESAAIENAVNSQRQEESQEFNQVITNRKKELSDLVTKKDTERKSYIAGIGEMLIEQGVDLAKLTKEEIQEFAKEVGVGVAQMKVSFSQAKKKREDGDLDTEYKRSQITKNSREEISAGSTSVQFDEKGNIVSSYTAPKESTANSTAAFGPGVVAGYNISRYATNPRHEINVSNLYKNAQGKDLSSLVGSAPVTAQMIQATSTKYGIDPYMLYAMMKEDSNLGQSGTGARNNNPGNIGQFDNIKGAVKGYPTMQEGVDAVGQWLSRNKSVSVKDGSDLLSVEDARKLGLPYGTTKQQAADTEATRGESLPRADATTKRQLSEKKAATETILKELNDLSGLYDTYGNFELLGDGASAINTKKGLITGAIKKAEQLGTLDQGVLTLVDKLIGNPRSIDALTTSPKQAKLNVEEVKSYLLSQYNSQATQFSDTTPISSDSTEYNYDSDVAEAKQLIAEGLISRDEAIRRLKAKYKDVTL